MILSVFLFISSITFLIVLIIIAIKKLNFFKQVELNKNNYPDLDPKVMNLQALLKGLNQNKKRYIILYYAHFFVLWISIGILIFITPLVPSIPLWIIVILLQLTGVVIHLVQKLYKVWFDYFIALYREVQLTFICGYLFILHFVDQSTE